MAYPPMTLERFWQKVDKNGPTFHSELGPCWLWHRTNPDGYGKTTIKLKHWSAHRLAWFYTFGEIPEDLEVCHKCDTRNCVRPDHLWLGTTQENTQDMMQKGRHPKGYKAAKHLATVLNGEKVVKMRELFAQSVSIKEIAKQFDTVYGWAYEVVTGRSWKELPGQVIITEIAWDMRCPMSKGRFREIYRKTEPMPKGVCFQQLKKGRSETRDATNQALATARTNSANQAQQYAPENADIGGLEASGPGGLGSAAASQLANAQQDISRNYGNVRTAVAKGNAQRGFAFAPDAAFASGINSADMAEAGDRNHAFNNAQMLQRENTLAAINARSGLQSIYNPVPAEGTAINGGQAMNNQGSTLGDIGKGIGIVAGLGKTILG